jgi:Ca2+-binding RTX toxin-like protein
MIIKGTKKADVLAGGNADDLIKGGKGKDVLIGAGGADTMKGGKGADTFVVSYGDQILDFKPGVDKIVVDQPYEGQLYLDATGLYTGVDANDAPIGLIVSTPGTQLGSDDFLNV